MLGPTLEGHPQALFVYRLIDVAIAAAGLAALLWLGLAARFTREEFYAYAVPLACIPALAPIAGAVNNDNLAFFGGAVVTLGLWQAVVTERDGWLVLALAGVVAASWAKLTGFLLTVPMASGVMTYLLWRGRLPWLWIPAALAVLALAATPYFEFILSYGSPTPETPAQLALIADGAHAAGWDVLPRKSFAELSRLFRRRIRRRLDADARRPQRVQLRNAGHSRRGARLRGCLASRCRCAASGGGRRPRSTSSSPPDHARSRSRSRSMSISATSAISPPVG